jgi:hypothetical protein
MPIALHGGPTTRVTHAVVGKGWWQFGNGGGQVHGGQDLHELFTGLDVRNEAQGAAPRGRPDSRAANTDILNFMFATSAVWKSLKKVLSQRAGLLAKAALARDRAIGGHARGSSMGLGQGEILGYLRPGPEEHLVRGLPAERWVWHLRVVLADVEFHQRTNPRHRVQAVQEEPLMLQSTPQRLHDGVGEGNLDLRQHAIRFYDVLGALVVIAELGRVRDRRCADALDMIERKRLADGMFPVEWTNVRTVDRIESRGTYADWGPLSKRKGHPLVTVDAQWVLREAGRGV